MNYKIQSHPGMQLAGYKTRVNPQTGFETIPKLWADLPKEKYEELAKLNNRPPKGMIGGEECFSETEMDYYIAVATEGDVPAGFDTLQIQPGTWAIIEAEGPLPGALQAVWAELKEKGFSDGEYVWAMQKPDMEVYPEGDMQAADYKCYIWLPLRPHWAEEQG